MGVVKLFGWIEENEANNLHKLRLFEKKNFRHFCAVNDEHFAFCYLKKNAINLILNNAEYGCSTLFFSCIFIEVIF